MILPQQIHILNIVNFLTTSVVVYLAGVNDIAISEVPGSISYIVSGLSACGTVVISIFITQVLCNLGSEQRMWGLIDLFKILQNFTYAKKQQHILWNASHGSDKQLFGTHFLGHCKIYALKQQSLNA